MNIEKIVKRLTIEYTLLWILPAALALCYEMTWFMPGFATDNGTAAYLLECGAVLMTFALVPISLRMTGKFLQRILTGKAPQARYKSYLRWSETQLFLLTALLLTDISVYYATQRSLGILLAAVAGIASLFCIPSKEKVAHYLSDSPNTD